VLKKSVKMLRLLAKTVNAYYEEKKIDRPIDKKKTLHVIIYLMQRTNNRNKKAINKVSIFRYTVLQKIKYKSMHLNREGH